MFSIASSTFSYIPAAVAANIAAPNAHAWSVLQTFIGLLMTPHIVCITNGDLSAMPPMPMTLSITIPSLSNLSTIAFVPYAVASTNARKTCGAFEPRVNPAIVPFNN